MNRREMLTGVLGLGSLSAVGTLARAGARQSDVPGFGDRGFKSLFNGRDLTGFVGFVDPGAQGADPDRTWRVRDGIIVCSGQPNGYLRTEAEFGNFLLYFEYRMAQPGNSGVFFMNLPDKIWPYGIEFQLLHTEVARIFGVDGGRVDGGAVLQQPTRPIGEWNSYSIVHHNGVVASAVNGQFVAVGANAEPRRGHLVWQSEGVEIHWREMWIKELE